MIKFLINRPIAVLITLGVFLIFGLLTFTKVPVSLLPDISIPEITIKITYPNTSSEQMESAIAKVVRDNMLSLNGIDDVESTSSNNSAIVHLSFNYGTRMDLAFIDINEKIDRLANILPKDMPRPQVIQSSTSNISLIKIQVIPKPNIDYLSVSDLTERILKKRLEQIDGVSLVDINGIERAEYTVSPNYSALAAVGLSIESLDNAIRSSNIDFGSLVVKDGIYKYYVRVSNQLANIDDIKTIPLKLNNGAIISLGKICNIEYTIKDPVSYHLYNGQKGLIITVQKQASARVNVLIDKVYQTIKLFEKDYPQVNFYVTQDQSFLLQAGISNLYQDLLIGGGLCVLLLFLFLGNYASPIIMSISIPFSLIITFIFFYFFNISFNIISLSGLALGLGMLIDNSILVIDNITRKRRNGNNIEDSCVIGTNEVIVPVISQVLTTIAVYAPLIYLSGMAGALVYDQAIALTISLLVSLLVAFCLNPVLYKLFLNHNIDQLKDDSRFYTWLSHKYHRMIYYIFPRKKIFFGLTLLLMPIGFILFYFVPVRTLPHIEETETLITVDWNTPISINENIKRTQTLINAIRAGIIYWEGDIGVKQYLLQQENTSVQNTEIYYNTKSEDQKQRIDDIVKKYLSKNFPDAEWTLKNAPNAFTELFENKAPYVEARFREMSLNSNPDSLALLLTHINKSGWLKGDNFSDNPDIEFKINFEKLALYGVGYDALLNELKIEFGTYTISEIKRFDNSTVIELKNDDQQLSEKLTHQIQAKNGASYALSNFLTISYGRERKYLTADKTGVFQSINFYDENIGNIKNLTNQITQLSTRYGYNVTYTGKYFTGQKMLKEMIVIFIISILLLYFILAVQFENLIHPLIVMFTIPLGIFGAMLLLWLCGGTMDIMAAIGFVVVLGIVVDDPILKVETINRLRKEYGNTGNKAEVLEKVLHEAGEICLKPLLLTSLTTSLALVPVLFTGGIGNDLQKPLVYVICGGLTIGTFFTLWFIPLAYWFFTKKA